MKYTEEPFTFSEVLAYLGISYNTNTKNPVITCPMCGKKDLYIDITKNKGHCFRSSCDFKCNQISYLAKVMGVSNKDAICLMKNKVHLNLPPVTFEEVIQTAEPCVLNKAYRNLISLMPLSKQHILDMMARGLSEQQIKKFSYGSFEWDESIARKIQHKGVSVKGVPGFYVDESNNWMLKKTFKGIMVPYYNHEREITGIQIRKNNSDIKIRNGKKDGKYTWITSNGKKDGSKVTNCCHFACDWCVDFKTLTYKPLLKNNYVLITEGAMKADIVHLLSGDVILAVPGTQNLSGLKSALKFLKNVGITNIIDVLDMDYVDNEDVKRAMQNIKGMVQNEGLSYQRRDWNPFPKENVYLKGYDDFLVYNKNKK